MNSTVEQLKEVLNMPNPQNFRIKTDLGQRCKRCTGKCRNNYYSLDREYGELKVVISNMRKHKEPMECFKHSTVTYHPPHNCNKAKCICDKCDEKRERLERTGSTSCIKTCTVCQLQTDDFESRSSGAIVCGKECNGVLTIMNMVNKDKSGKPQSQLIQEKLQIWIDKFGYDPEDEDDKSEEQDKIDKMSGKIQKYLKKEFKGRIFSEYPKERIEEALDVIVPPEITEMISEHIENKELTQVIPIRTINDIIEWTEEIRQPWELNGEIIWPEEELLENPIPIMNIIQEKGNILLTKYVDKNNDLKERIEELEQEINFGNVLFNQIIDLNMTISSNIDVDPSMENMEPLRY
ncbi:hypothetical protein RhiirA5_423519 [Rhizophagus irregularis]|uniref:Uncharacterized protein n=1 Tax=Rhizophagus irregularis TaxID=588596 RepID=A0A2N0P9U3_9GLOM|nr:hypothetical protein RhiirA5_423519 [Rhizophagus irregularis]